MNLQKKKLLLGMFIVSMFLFSGCGKTTINLDKYVTITSTGYDSLGTATTTFDYDGFEKDYEGKIKISNKGGNSSELGLLLGETPAEMLLDFCVGKSLDKSSELCNGDVITLKWNCEDEMAEEYFNVKLEYTDITYTVSELKEVGKFNPFDYATVTFSGVEPDGTVYVEGDETPEEMQKIYFTVDKNSGIKVGDSVTVYANLYGDLYSFVEKYGCILSEDKQVFECKELDKYVTDRKQIPDGIMSDLINRGKDAFNSYVNRTWDKPENVEDISYKGYYFLNIKEETPGYPSNYIYYIYKINATNPMPNQSIEYYYYVGFRSIMKLAEGGFAADLDNYIVPDPSWFGSEVFNVGNYVYAGYQDMESLFENCIADKLDKYEYMTSID